MTGVGLNLNTIINKFSEATNQKYQDLAAAVNNSDPTDPAQTVKLQMKMMEAQMTVQLESALTKSIEDTLKAVIQRM